MNGNVELFLKKCARAIPADALVLDVGSYNVNGAVRDYLPVTIGVDARDGPGVDAVVDACDLIGRFDSDAFDVVVSTDALEHMEDWFNALVNMWGVLRDGGLLILTMAAAKKGRHNHPNDFWRWSDEEFYQVFGENEILAKFAGGPSIGAMVRKTAPLDLSIKPRPVP